MPRNQYHKKSKSPLLHIPHRVARTSTKPHLQNMIWARIDPCIDQAVKKYKFDTLRTMLYCSSGAHSMTSSRLQPTVWVWKGQSERYELLLFSTSAPRSSHVYVCDLKFDFKGENWLPENQNCMLFTEIASKRTEAHICARSILFYLNMHEYLIRSHLKFGLIMLSSFQIDNFASFFRVHCCRSVHSDLHWLLQLLRLIILRNNRPVNNHSMCLVLVQVR